MVGYVVLKLCMWEDLEFEDEHSPFPVMVGKPELSPGYLLVFHDEEKAVEFAGDESLVRQIVTGIGR